jgi:hypothetical protein
MGLFGILAALGLLIFLAYKGWSGSRLSSCLDKEFSRKKPDEKARQAAAS